jgi:hypothetical protein
MNKNIFLNYPQENCYDLSAITQGKLTKFMFEEIINHFCQKQIPIYGVYVPVTKKMDIFDWQAINVETNIIPSQIQDKIWKEYKIECTEDSIIPTIIFANLGEQEDGIYCFAVGTNNLNMIWEKKNIPFNDIDKVFGKENIMIIKIG